MDCLVLLTRLYFSCFGLKFGNLGIHDKNYISFIVRNKPVERSVNGVKIVSVVHVSDGRTSLCRSKKLLLHAGFSFKYSEKGAKVGGVSTNVYWLEDIGLICDIIDC